MPNSQTEHLPLANRRMIELLRALEQDRGWSQTRSGKMIGLSQGAVSNIITGAQKKIAATQIAAAQDKLGLDPRYFFDPILHGDGTYHAYLRRSDAERYSRPVIPAAPAGSNTDHSYSQKYETTKGTREREAREAAERLAKKKGPVRRR